jgi:hypothetical protein
MRVRVSTVAGCLALQVAGAGAAESEEEAVRRVAGYYLQGHATGDPEPFRKAFHPEAKLSWIKDGKLAQRTSADYIAGASGKPADDEAQRKRRIVSVDLAGTAAVVKVELDYPQARLVDYLSMLKVDGEWKIVHKTFHAEPKTTK